MPVLIVGTFHFTKGDDMPIDLSFEALWPYVLIMLEPLWPFISLMATIATAVMVLSVFKRLMER